MVMISRQSRQGPYFFKPMKGRTDSAKVLDKHYYELQKYSKFIFMEL